jgi:glycosyltransferase involved in cell wall biosynthesis
MPPTALRSVVQLERRPWAANFSIENYFARVRKTLEEMGCHVDARQLPFHSKGVIPRWRNARFAAEKQGEVTHLTGDVHYATALCRPETTVLTILDCHALERLSGWKRSIFKHFWYTLPLNHARFVTVISEETKRNVLKYCDFDESRIIVIPVSVSEGFSSQPKASFPGCPRILHVGTKPNKNLQRLIPALEGLPCELSIVGPLNGEQAKLLAKHRIRYVQKERLTDNEIIQEYRNAHVVSFVSTYEGFGMPIVEAQCAQRPVITSNTSSMPEVAGNGAFFVDPFDVTSIREGFVRLFESDDLRRSLIENGLENARRFNHDLICEQYLDLYQKAAA